LRIKLLGIHDPANDLLYYLVSKSDVEIRIFDHNLPINDCIHQINNARAKLKDIITQATQLWSEFKVDLATAVIEHKHEHYCTGEEYDAAEKCQFVEKEVKSRENRRTTKKSWRKLERQIRGHIKPNTLNHSELTSVGVQGGTPGSWHRLDRKEAVEDHLIERNFEQFSHAGATPLGYTALGAELGHTGDSPMADAIHARTMVHPALSDKAILAIVKN
jgi:hypothetical protein